MEDEPAKTRIQPFEKNVKYLKPEVEDKIVELRKKGTSWEDTRDIMRDELDEPRMSRTAVKKIHDRALARTVTIEKRAGKKYTDHTEALNDMYSTSLRGLSRYVKAIDRLSEQLDNAVDDGSLDVMKAYGIFLKTAPQVKAIWSEMRDFMKFTADQQDKIIIQQKDVIWSEDQVNDKINITLEKLKDEGKIIWVKPKLM